MSLWALVGSVTLTVVMVVLAMALAAYAKESRELVGRRLVMCVCIAAAILSLVVFWIAGNLPFMEVTRHSQLEFAWGFSPLFLFACGTLIGCNLYHREKSWSAVRAWMLAVTTGLFGYSGLLDIALTYNP